MFAVVAWVSQEKRRTPGAMEAPGSSPPITSSATLAAGSRRATSSWRWWISRVVRPRSRSLWMATGSAWRCRCTGIRSEMWNVRCFHMCYPRIAGKIAELWWQNIDHHRHHRSPCLSSVTAHCSTSSNARLRPSLCANFCSVYIRIA